jgi:hypothetical protein
MLGETIRIYRKNNYIVLIDGKNDKYEEHYSNVYVQRNKTNESLYDILLMRFDTVIKSFYALDFADIKQENNASFATAELWEDWYTSNTGFNNAGAISTDVNANLKVGGTNVSNTNPVPVNIISGGGSILTASVEVYRIINDTPLVIPINALSISIQNIGNYNVTVTTNASTNVGIDPGISVTWDAPSGYKLPAFTFSNSNILGVFLLTVVR